VPVAVAPREVAAPDALGPRDRQRLAEHALARPRGRELPDAQADDVLVGADADHPPPALVDEDQPS
jgi:hypothetical protein